MSRLRVLATIALSLLLVGVQLGAHVHALEHDAKRLGDVHCVALAVPGVDDGCSTCASFAGSSHGTPGGGSLLLIERGSAAHVRSKSLAVAGTAPAYYQSRAPPSAPPTYV